MLIAIFGVIIHVIFLNSIFDIYFKSPIIHGMTPYSIPVAAPAKRLALFVADGLRADKLFEVDTSGASKAPFLRNIVLKHGAWGVSHTRVPTESRPGHVAITAGIYEDVSAVMKGWQENPVDFDSVFNESRYTWAWGSPDILPMFSKGKKNNVFINVYSSEEEDFAGADPSEHDTWVYNKFEAFLKEAATNNTLSELLHQDKIIFFFHLLGLDISGHSYKPWSREYEKNIEVVDQIVEKAIRLIDDFYKNDSKTSYLFTSDHGMTDWGSHGSGDPEETHTPIITWGAGIRGPLGEGKDIYFDGYSERWKLSHVKRVDINQVDLTPFMAALIGIPFPVNSLGILPVEYMDTEWSHKALSLLTNARQILAHYKKRMKTKQESTLPFFFWNFKELSSSRQAELMAMIETLLKQNRYTDAIQVGMKMIEVALKGIMYFHKYDQFALSFAIFMGFLGWMAYVVILILKDHTTVCHSSLESSVVASSDMGPVVKTTLVYTFVGSVVGCLLYAQSAPLMYYTYFFFPVVLWYMVCLRLDVLHFTKMYIERRNYAFQLVTIFALGFLGLELLVVSYFKRHVLSVVLWGLSMWPFFTRLKSTHKKLIAAWCVTCLVMSVFPLLPVVGRDSHYNLVAFAGWLSVFVIAFCSRRPETGLIYNSRQSKKEPPQVVYLTAIQVIILCIATYNVQSTSQSISKKEGLPLLNQIISWLILVSSLIMPLFGSNFIFTRLLNIMTSMLALYLLTCISHEGLFCLSLCLLMFLWICIEHSLSFDYRRLQDMTFDPSSYSQRRDEAHRISVEDLRRAYFFMFFILLAFFGTGNIASINSFEPSSVYCFLTIFNPFVMGFLMLLKIMIPFVIVSCSLQAVLVTLKASPRALFLLILLMSDFMGMHFFFMVQDTGSWLEIGTSISHYVINITIIIFVVLLHGLARLLTSCTLEWHSLRRKRHLL